MLAVETLRHNLQLFRAMCEDRLRREGVSPQGVRSVADLVALEDVLAGGQPFRGELFGPLSSFANLCASGNLPGAFSPANLGDACVALGAVLASKGLGRWRFEPALTKRSAEKLGFERVGGGLDRMQRENRSGWEAHASDNASFIRWALERVPHPGTAVVVGAARSHDLPLGELAARFEKVIVVDVCEPADTRAGVKRAIADASALERVAIERFDLTGSYNQFVADAGAIVARAGSEGDAERELDDLVSAYDVDERDVRLCREDVEPDFAVSSMVLTQLGLPYKAFVGRAFRARGFDPERVRAGILGDSLTALSCRVEQQHIAALLRLPKLSVLTSDVREGPVTLRPTGEVVALAPSQSQLSVPTLSDRVPSGVTPLARGEWDWLRVVPRRPGAPGSLMNVEGLVFARSS
jgi:hypothetical protein